MERASFRLTSLCTLLCVVALSSEFATAGPLNRLRQRRTTSNNSLPTNRLRDSNLPAVPAENDDSTRLSGDESSADDVEERDTGLQDENMPLTIGSDPNATQPERNETPEDAGGEVAEDDEELSAELLDLRSRLRTCLKYYYDRPENAASRSAWGIMHWAIAFGVDTRVISNDRKMTAIGYLCWNGACRGQRLFYTSDGKLQARFGSGYQGHDGQFLAVLAQSRVRSSYPMRVGGHKFTVGDLIEYEKLTCRPNSELTFKLIALAHYLPSDAQWQDNQGREWTIERLIKEELAQPIIGETCGGTHRMTGFSYAVRTREKRGEPMTGQWLRAKKYVDAFHDYTFKLQNEDGSFSTNWFESRGDWGNRDRRLRTTGHILEWLVYSLPKEQLSDLRVIEAVDYLTELLWEHREHQWEIGPLGHGLHALVIYDQRLFGAKPGQGGPQVDNSLARAKD